jgi:hypothetical protein
LSSEKQGFVRASSFGDLVGAQYHFVVGSNPECVKDLSGEQAAARARALKELARTDALEGFEGALDLLRDLVRIAAQREFDARREEGFARPVRDLLKVVSRLLRQDARRREHEIDRESAWFILFEMWLRDDAGILDDFEQFLTRAATLLSDRKLLVRLAADELADLPIVFPLGGDTDVRRMVLNATRARLETVIATLLAQDGNHAYAAAFTEEERNESARPAALAELLRSCQDPATALQGAGRALRLHLETAFLRDPADQTFQAVKAVVPADQWAAVRSRLLGHLQKHQRVPSLVFKLYWNEGLLLDADGLVVTQPVDPDVLAHAAMKLKEHEPIVAAGWLLISACRLADSFPRSRWPDVVEHLVLVRDLTAESDRDGEFDRVLRTFRFRHAQCPDLLNRLNEVGL